MKKRKWNIRHHRNNRNEIWRKHHTWNKKQTEHAWKYLKWRMTAIFHIIMWREEKKQNEEDKRLSTPRKRRSGKICVKKSYWNEVNQCRREKKMKLGIFNEMKIEEKSKWRRKYLTCSAEENSVKWGWKSLLSCLLCIPDWPCEKILFWREKTVSPWLYSASEETLHMKIN